MFDWVTWSIEAVGIAILCIWIVVPIGEFRSIFQRLKASGAAEEPKDGDGG